MGWLINNAGTIAIILILAAVIAAIIIKLVYDKKHGKSSCGCNCAHCAMSGICSKSGNGDK